MPDGKTMLSINAVEFGYGSGFSSVKEENI
jgi:uncharacterized spore protein YtfJ